MLELALALWDGLVVLLDDFHEASVIHDGVIRYELDVAVEVEDRPLDAVRRQQVLTTRLFGPAGWVDAPSRPSDCCPV